MLNSEVEMYQSMPKAILHTINASTNTKNAILVKALSSFRSELSFLKVTCVSTEFHDVIYSMMSPKQHLKSKLRHHTHQSCRRSGPGCSKPD